MPVHYTIDSARGVVVVEMIGSVGAPEVLAFLERLAGEPTFQPGMPLLIDCGRLVSPPTVAGSETVARGLARMTHRFAGTRCAVLVRDALMYGATRQFAALAAPAGFDVRPFLEASAAREWLGVAGP